jgi:zinc protease
MKFKNSVITDEPVQGLSTFVVPTQVKDVITISGSMLGGMLFSNNNKISSLTSSMLDKGTRNKSKHEINNQLESIGAEISFISSNRHINFTAHCLKPDLDTVVQLIAEQLREAVFPEDELDVLKKRIIANLEISKDDTKKQALVNFIREIYPEGHYNSRNTIDQAIKNIDVLKTDDLVSFHEKTFGLGSLKIAAAGDISNDLFSGLIKTYFDGWKGQTVKQLEQSVSSIERMQSSLNKNINDKTSTDIFMGQTVELSESSEDYLSLMMGIYILGGNFSARLMQTVRDEQGLTYGIGSTLAGCSYGINGHWHTWGTIAPDLVDKGIASTLKQIKKWHDNGVSKEELDTKKTTINGLFKVSLDTTGGVIDKILTNAEKGREITYLDNYTKLINELDKNKVNEVINKYIDPGKFITSISGSIA